MRKRVWTTTVSHDHGLDVLGIFFDEEEAFKKLYDYVSSWWDDLEQSFHSAGGTVPDEVPEDMDEAVELYYEHHPDPESYDIRPHMIDLDEEKPSYTFEPASQGTIKDLADVFARQVAPIFEKNEWKWEAEGSLYVPGENMISEHAESALVALDGVSNETGTGRIICRWYFNDEGKVVYELRLDAFTVSTESMQAYLYKDGRMK